MDFVNLGCISFEDAYDLQVDTIERVAAGQCRETVYLLEHPHVFTIGRRGLRENLVVSSDFEGRPIDVVCTNRGGDITYHGPGQLVVYPHFDLRERGRDLNQYLRGLEECVIRVAGNFGVESYRRKGLTGVWTDHGKLASIGVGVRKWITMHGLALNVSPELRFFELINPCGIPDCPVTSLQQILGGSLSMSSVKETMVRAIREVFKVGEAD